MTNLKSLSRALASAAAILLAGDAIAQTCIQLPTNCPISSGFGYRIHPVTKEKTPKMHGGIDFACPMYTPIKAAAPGQVTASRWSNIGGNMLFIQSGDYQMGYLHNEQVIAQPGANVPVGEVVAKVGNTGASTGPHLHFQVKNGLNRPIDPMSMFCSKPSFKPGVLQGDTNPPDSEPSPPETVAADTPTTGAPPMMNDHLGSEGSLREILFDAVGSRAFNPDYQHQISKLSDTRLYGELAYMGTLRLRMQQESAATRERVLATSAMLQVLMAEKVLKPQIDVQRAAATRAVKPTQQATGQTP